MDRETPPFGVSGLVRTLLFSVVVVELVYGS